MIEPVSFPPIELTPELEADSRKRPYIFGEGGGVAEAMFAEIDRLRAVLATRDRQLAELRAQVGKAAELLRGQVKHLDPKDIANRHNKMAREMLVALLPPTAKEEPRERNPQSH